MENFDELLEAAARGERTYATHEVINACSNQMVGFTVAYALNRLADATNQVAEIAAQIENDLDTVKNNVAKGMHLNSLGELQGRGTRLDLAVAVREERLTNANAMVALAEELNG